MLLQWRDPEKGLVLEPARSFQRIDEQQLWAAPKAQPKSDSGRGRGRGGRSSDGAIGARAAAEASSASRGPEAVGAHGKRGGLPRGGGAVFTDLCNSAWDN